MNKKCFIANLHENIIKSKNRKEVNLIILDCKNLISELFENKEMSVYDCLECLEILKLLTLTIKI